MPDLETDIRKTIAQFCAAEPDGFAMSDRLDTTLGFTSMKMVLLITSLCTATGVGLGAFTEHDLAEMTTAQAIHDRFSREFNAVETTT